MIQSFQKFSQSRVAKIFLAIVALSFVAFFGGGNFFRPHDTTATIAEVGNLSISRYEFSQKVREQTQRLSAESGDQMSKEELLQSGLPRMVLNHMIQEILLGLEAEYLGLAVSDETVVAQIQSIKAFQNEKGVFDRNRFTQIIRSHGMSEDTFISEVHQEIVRDQLSNAIMVGAHVPDEMLNRLFNAQYQHRQASQLIISPKDIPAPPAPAQDVLEAFYKKNEKFFETPELRTISALVIDPAALAKDIPVTDAEMRATYDAKIDTFGKKPFEDVKPLVKADVQKEKANEETYKITQELDDKIAAGATFEELVSQTKGAQLIKLNEIDSNGHDRLGTPSPTLPKTQELANELLQTGFSLDESADSPFSQAKNGSYYTVRVDKITPKALQPFTEVKDRVLKVWTEIEQLKEAHDKAVKYAESFNKGDRKVALMTLLPNMSLSEPSVEIPNEVQELVFSLRPGKAGIARVPEGFAVVVMNTILPPEAGVKEEKMASFKELILKQYKSDLLSAYLNALRIRYPVKINQEAFAAFAGQ